MGNPENHKSLIHKGVKAAVPAVGALERLHEISKRPIAATIVGALALGSIYGTARYITGYVTPEVDVEKTIEVVEPGRADAVDVDLLIEETPLIALTAAVSGEKVALSKEFVMNAGWLPQEIRIETEKSHLEWRGEIDLEVCYDPSMVDIEYEKNLIDDPSDDRIIARVPLDAFCTSVNVQPGDRWEVDEDARSILTNVSGAMTDSFSFLENVPGLGDIAEGNRTDEQAARDVAVIGALDGVEEVCTPMFIQHPIVYPIVKDHIAGDIINTVSRTENIFDDFEIDEFREIEKVVYIGDENDSNPTNLNQVIAPRTEYADEIAEVEALGAITYEESGAFECKISDQVIERRAKELMEISPVSPRIQAGESS